MIRSAPRSLWVPAILALAFVIAPLLALLARVDWPGLPAILASPQALGALGLSFLTAAIATAACILFGVPLALCIAGLPSRAANFARACVVVPLLMPPLVGGLALLALFGRRGALGALLQQVFGTALPFTTAAVVFAQAFVALPFLVIAVEQAARAVDGRQLGLARTLGATPGFGFWHVTLPTLAPSILAGGTLAFARALAEFGATAMFAGNVAGVTRTMPLAIYSSFQGGGGNPEQAYALAAILIIAAVLVLVSVRGWRIGGAR